MVVGHTTSRKLTYEDLVAFPEDGKRHEILDGEHYVSPAPTRGHQVSVANLVYFFKDFLRRRPLGQILPAPFDVLFSDHDVVEPDLVYVSHERAAILREENAKGAPDLVIEVLSPATRRRDLGVKRALYERSGVAEYWLVDPRRHTVTVLRREGAGFGRPQDLTAGSGDTLTTLLLPGLEIPVREIFG